MDDKDKERLRLERKRDEINRELARIDNGIPTISGKTRRELEVEYRSIQIQLEDLDERS